MSFLANFTDNLHCITPQIHALITASRSVKNSIKLRRLLEIILAFGEHIYSVSTINLVLNGDDSEVLMINKPKLGLASLNHGNCRSREIRDSTFSLRYSEWSLFFPMQNRLLCCVSVILKLIIIIFASTKCKTIYIDDVLYFLFFPFR